MALLGLPCHTGSSLAERVGRRSPLRARAARCRGSSGWERGLRSCGYRLPSHAGVWGLPGPGIKPRSGAQAGWFSPPEPPRKPCLSLGSPSWLATTPPACCVWRASPVLQSPSLHLCFSESPGTIKANIIIYCYFKWKFVTMSRRKKLTKIFLWVP